MDIKTPILIILFLTSGLIYYNLTPEKPTTITAQVTRIIDGDTLQLNDSTKVRLLGINTPEKNQPYYQEAKNFLEQKLINQTIQLEPQGQDKYQRTLAYIFLNNQNINAKILEQGLATLYYYDHDSHYQKLKEAESHARESSLGLWKKSPNSECIKILEFKTDEPETLILENSCPYKINLTYKDDATHIYQATIKAQSNYQNNFSHIWNTDGDSLYVYDNNGLILFYRYP